MTEIQEIQIDSPLYPGLLKQIHDPPRQIFALGNVDLLQNPFSIALVGTRRYTAYAYSVTEKLVAEVVPHGLVIVSGLARGIDSIAHRAALKAGGQTVAVLGQGIDVDKIYPREHKKLLQEIIEGGGLIISEYGPGTPPRQFRFVARNRIIVGLCKGVVVIEAPEGSGALITADFAADYNREVLAVPGQITNPAAFGPNKLIAEGAKLVTNCADVLEIFELLPLKMPAKSAPNYSLEQKTIIGVLAEEPRSLSEIIERTQLNVATVSENLTNLELIEKIIQGR